MTNPIASALRRPEIHVLIVDDEPEAQESLATAIGEFGTCDVVPPDFVTLSDLLKADLILVDLTLTHVPWSTEVHQPIAQRPIDGLALIGVLRSHVNDGARRQPLFALHTGHIRNLVPDLPAEIGQNVAARLNNLEWVFDKVQPTIPPVAGSPQSAVNTTGRLAERIAILAEAAKALPDVWDRDAISAEQFVVDFLGLDPDQVWTSTAYREVRSCHPPLFELAADTHGLAFIRWLLHRILPYPCFLLDTNWFAHRLRLSIGVVEGLLAEAGEFAKFWTPAEYRGTLSGFSGKRWWRAGVDSLMSDLANGDPFDLEMTNRKIQDLASHRELEFYPPSFILNMDALYQVRDPGPRSESVRVTPDDWPPYADEAFATIADVQSDDGLRRIVRVDDIALVEVALDAD